MQTASLFWDRQPLKNLNHLCLRSLIDKGYAVNVFSYNTDLFLDYKTEINIIDANEIIEEKNKFYYLGNGNCAYRSVVGFSDIFRYKLLYKTGGWYFDFDTIALKKLSNELIEADVVLRPNFKYKVVSNICKFNKENKILLDLYTETASNVNEKNDKWSLPLEIFSNIIERNNLESKIAPVSCFGDDDTMFLRDILYKKITDLDLSTFYSLHICNTFLSSGKWFADFFYNVNQPRNMSLLHFLYKKYDLL
jgi:hypothetical protein